MDTRSAPVIIVGVHRSGTSLLTRMLDILGLFIGNDLQGDHESRSFISVNNQYFLHTNSSWDKPAYPSTKHTRENIIRRVLAKNETKLLEKYGEMSGFWGFKDPRTLTTLPLWMDTFPSSKIIYIRRSPWSIAKSLTRRHQDLIEKGVFPAEGDFAKGRIKFTQRCSTLDGSLSLAIEQQSFFNRLVSQGIVVNHLELSYEELLQDPLFQLSRISAYLSKPFSRARVLKAAALPKHASDVDAEIALPHYFSGK